jgi:hypothetical protein
MSDTNAVKWLRAQGVDFRELMYEFAEVGADHATKAVGRQLEMVCKMLIFKAADKRAGGEYPCFQGGQGLGRLSTDVLAPSVPGL